MCVLCEKEGCFAEWILNSKQRNDVNHRQFLMCLFPNYETLFHDFETGFLNIGTSLRVKRVIFMFLKQGIIPKMPKSFAKIPKMPAFHNSKNAHTCVTRQSWEIILDK